YSGQDDISVGSPIANRRHAETEGLIGMFVNMLTMRSRIDGNEPFSALLEQIKATCLEAYEHQDAPFEKVVDAVRPQRNLAISPLFQVAFVLQNMELGQRDASIEPYGLDACLSKYDLTLVLSEAGEGLSGVLEYSTALYKPATIARMAEHFAALCAAIADAPETKLHDLHFLGEAETQRLLVEFNATAADYPTDECLHDAFVARASREPNAIAVLYGERQWTYGELLARSQRLALYLQAAGVEPDQLVGVCVDRTVDMLVAMLGILQAGGAYVPLDPAYPDDRLAYMVRDSRATIVLIQETLRAQLATLVPSETQLVALDTQWAEIDRRVAQLEDGGFTLEQRVRPDHLAYIIYTSGSTGQPKGVAIEHHSPVTLVHWGQDVYSENELAGVLASTSICFDLSVYEIFLTLSSGGTIILVPNALGLIDLPNKEAVTLINTVPSAGEELARLNAIPPSVRTINLAGEPLSARLVDRLYETTNVAKVYDLYGPSEDTTYSTYTLRTQNGAQTIGRPIANTQVYILDKQQQVQPIGVPGELFIAGDGLARGYLYRPELTDEKFIANPFQAGTRMYRTGDLARWMEDGTIQYLGRIDTQVKVRGFRIEIGEIEARLAEHPAIQDCAVIAKGEGADRQIVAFYRGKDGTEIPTDELRAHLAKTLPEYMIPAAFVSLTAIPLSPNGKVDRRALARMDVTVTSGREYVAARNERERQLVAIWAQVLGRTSDTIGIHDNFFELGGHSLLATQLVSRIRTEMNVELPLKALFERSSVAQLAEVVGAAPKSEVPPITHADRTQELPLSFAQERLWFIHQLEPKSAGYNIPVALLLRGAVDVDQLDRAFNVLIERHESLRTVFPSHEGHAHQRVLDRLELRLERIEASADQARQICQADAMRAFDLANGPLLRGKVIRVAADEHVLLLNMHHIISDGWSLGVLIRELTLILGGHSLAPLPIQYADFSVWQRKWLEGSGVLDRQLAYWQQKLAGAPESLDLPTDYARPSTRSFAGATQPIALDAALTAQIQQLAEAQGATPYMVLLAAFQTLLHRYTGQDDICVGSPIANRQYGETEGLVGMFVNTLALRSQVHGDDPFTDLLAQVKATCLEAYEHQDAPFEKVVDAVRPQRNLAISPLFQVALVLQNIELGEGGANIEPFRLDHCISKFDLTLALSETSEGLSGAIEYSTALYKPATIERMAAHFTTLCRSVIAQPTARVREHQILGETEKHHLLAELNDTHADYRNDQCLHELFLAEVDAHADDTAVISGDERLTYRELYERSHDLALYLQTEGVRPDDLVGVCMERSAEMVVALYGILLAGGAYVPLDPDYPEDRLRHMVSDSGAAIVLTQEPLREKLAAFVTEETRVVTQWPERVYGTLEKTVTPANLAYVIYTSGSTGLPKGVMNEHRGIVNRLLWMQDAYRLDGTDAVLQKTPFSFDVSVWELFWPLFTGATLVMAKPEGHKDPAYLVETIRQNNITTLHFVPSMLQVFLEHEEASQCASLKRV
ncbi:MAG: amino acid adenylation domain-containing protein, partial [Acidobacteria bacterium]|nr:amino acid adenylation domain-containing protein [Acidobacteriota bacterium]